MLCHVPVSHYSEKARWALDYKRIPHTRRWPPGGFHPVVTFILTRGKHQTVPVLVMDGEGIGDSTEIIRRLEERFPSRRSTRPTPTSAVARSSWRTSSTRSSGRTSGGWPTTT